MIRLLYILILHQTTTKIGVYSDNGLLLYILILHQTTTILKIYNIWFCCFISWFYIKPQLQRCYCSTSRVALYLDSTSNHNYPILNHSLYMVALYLDSTSNHNLNGFFGSFGAVALYLDSTSNHNATFFELEILKLLYILILHQTTTRRMCGNEHTGCFISWFYIKPQHVLFKTLNINTLYKYFHTRSGSNISALLQIY